MKTLLILRHGKSDWDVPFDSDANRPLAARGREAAQRIGRMISEAKTSPDLVFTSPAVRARETARLAAAAGGWDAEIQEHRQIYEGGVGPIIKLITGISDQSRVVAIAGHQPTSAALVASLIGGGRLRFPTGAVACIQFPFDWASVAPGTGELRWFIVPRMLA